MLKYEHFRINIVVAAYPAFVYVVSRAGRQVCVCFIYVLVQAIIIIIIIIIIINRNWVLTRWQLLFYIHTNIEKKSN